jgi:cyclic pyranopterin phosphate synthase
MNASRHRLRSVYLRLSVTDRCNLHCRYCRSADVASVGKSLRPARDTELLAIVRLIDQVVPIYKLRLTGGEPLLHPALYRLVDDIRRQLPSALLSATTNGILLASQATWLRRAGLNSVNISLDSLDPETFQRISGGGMLQATIAGIRAARQCGFSTIKLNTVLVRSINGSMLPELVRFAASEGCEIRFIELMPCGEGSSLYEAEYLSAHEALSALRHAFVDLGPVSSTGIAERRGFCMGNGRAIVGFIHPISEPFCGSCDRLRLDHYGNLMSCLRDEQGIDLLGPWRQGRTAQVKRRIRDGLEHKRPFVHSWPSRNMISIGG